MNNLKLYRCAEHTRKKLGGNDSSPIDIFAVVQNIDNLSLVLYPFNEHISGMCIRIKDDAVIAINSSMSVGRQNFSIAHELYHYYYHKDVERTVCQKAIGKGEEREKEADKFASYLLMPLSLSEEGRSKDMTVEDVIKLEQYYRVSHQAMIYRLLEENLITKTQADKYRQEKVIQKAAQLGYDTSLYKPSREDKKCKTFGFYLKEAQASIEKDIISNGKYEQLLSEAFRTDIVYGDDVEGVIPID